jgi:hypothetical protein
MTQAVTLAQLGGADTTLPFRNRIINGSMTIDQRYSGANISAANGNNAYLIDRWAFYTNPTSKFNFGQNQNVTPTAATGQKYCLDFNNISGGYTPTASDYFVARQIIEGYNIADLLYGTSSAKTITLSFWVYSGVAGILGGNIHNFDQTRSYPFPYTINTINTWEFKTITIPGCTDGTWNTTNGSGMGVMFSLGNHSTLLGPPNAWASTNYNGPNTQVNLVQTANAQWAITGVQLEVGTVATPFERRPYGMELALCQRYYYKSGANAQGNASYQAHGSGGNQSNNTSANIFVPFKQTMRVTPTLSYGGNLGVTANGSYVTISNFAASYSGTDSSMLQTTHPAVGSAGQGLVLMSNADSTAFIAMSAEL